MRCVSELAHRLIALELEGLSTSQTYQALVEIWQEETGEKWKAVIPTKRKRR